MAYQALSDKLALPIYAQARQEEPEPGLSCLGTGIGFSGLTYMI